MCRELVVVVVRSGLRGIQCGQPARPWLHAADAGCALDGGSSQRGCQRFIEYSVIMNKHRDNAARNQCLADLYLPGVAWHSIGCDVHAVMASRPGIAGQHSQKAPALCRLRQGGLPCLRMHGHGQCQNQADANRNDDG